MILKYILKVNLESDIVVKVITVKDTLDYLIIVYKNMQQVLQNPEIARRILQCQNSAIVFVWSAANVKIPHPKKHPENPNGKTV